MGSKTRSQGQISGKPCVHTLEGTDLIISSLNSVRMLFIIMSRSGSNLGHVGSKTRSLGQILEKNLVLTLMGTVLIQNSLKLYQNANDLNI